MIKKTLAALAALLLVLLAAAPAQAAYYARYKTIGGYGTGIGLATVAQNDGTGIKIWQWDVAVYTGCSKLGATTAYGLRMRTYTPVTHTLIKDRRFSDMQTCQVTKHYIEMPGPDNLRCVYVVSDFTLNTRGSVTINPHFQYRNYLGSDCA